MNLLTSSAEGADPIVFWLTCIFTILAPKAVGLMLSADPVSLQAIKEEIDGMLHPRSHARLEPVNNPSPRQSSYSESLQDYMVTRASSSFEQLG